MRKRLTKRQAEAMIQAATGCADSFAYYRLHDYCVVAWCGERDYAGHAGSGYMSAMFDVLSEMESDADNLAAVAAASALRAMLPDWDAFREAVNA